MIFLCRNKDVSYYLLTTWDKKAFSLGHLREFLTQGPVCTSLQTCFGQVILRMCMEEKLGIKIVPGLGVILRLAEL